MFSGLNMIARLSSALEGRYAIDREIGRGGMATVYLDAALTPLVTGP